MEKIISRSEAETARIAQAWAASALPGSVFCLTGPLGAGKTAFVKGFLAGLQSAAWAASPTFALMHIYEGGRLPVCHIDAYRLEGVEACDDIGLEDYLYADGVCLIEWADRIADLMPPSAVWISFAYGPDGCDDRIITVLR